MLTAHAPSRQEIIPDAEFHQVLAPMVLASPSASPAESPSLVPTPSVPRPSITTSGTARSHKLTVTATWYCNNDVSRARRSDCHYKYPDIIGHDDFYAAISPDLSYLRGKTITVYYGGKSVVLKVVDCNCQATNSIDLYADAFEALSPLGSGRLRGVKIVW